MRELLVMAAADLRQRVRDRTVLVFGLLVPLGLMGVFNLVFQGGEGPDLQPTTVVASVPAGDPVGEAMLDVLRSVDAFEVTIEEVPPGEVRARTRADADLGLLVPPGFTPDVRSGVPTRVRLVESDRAGLETDVLVSVVDGFLARMRDAAVAGQAAVAGGVAPAQAEDVARLAATDGAGVTVAEGKAASEQLTDAGAIVAGQAGLFLLFTVGFGVLALLAEREQGTLARLHSLPVKPELVVAAKALSGFVLGVLATTVLLVSGSLMFGVGFGNPLLVGVVVLAAVAAATSLSFVVARVARTAEQASVAQSVVALVLGMLGGAFFPLSVSGPLAGLLDLNPVAALIRGLGITAGGGGLGDLAGVLAVLAGFALGGWLLSLVLPNRGVAP